MLSRTRWILVLAVAGLVSVPIMALAGTTTVTMANYSFTPQTATVSMGTTVQWSNSTASTPHTTTQYKGLLLWDSGTVNPGSSFSKTINFAGSYPYHCQFHYMLGMTGTVKVPIKVSAPALCVAKQSVYVFDVYLALSIE